MKFSSIVVLCLFGAYGAEADKPSLRGESEVSPIGERFLAFLDLDKRLDTVANKTVGPNKINYDIADPSCKNGVVSPDLKVCCTDECGSCGNHDLCDDPAAFAEANEKTGKLADNCCKARVAKAAKSCDESHAPCVLNKDYAKTLKTYVFKREKRHAMDDCNKAIEIARAKHDLGVEKGEWLAKLFLEGNTVYEDAKDIAINVDQLVRNKLGDIEDENDELERKIAAATDADKKVTQALGMSNVDKWNEALELNKNQVRFYDMILKNAKDVKGAANKGLARVDALKKEVQDVADIGVEKWELKMDAVTGDAGQVYSDAEFLWQQWRDSSKDYDCGPPPPVEHAQTQCDGGNTKFSFKCAITCAPGYDDQTSVNRLRCLKQGKFGKQLYGEWMGLATCIGRDCGVPPELAKATTVLAPLRHPNFAQYNCHEGYGMDDSVHSDKAFSIQCGGDGNYMATPEHKCVPVKCGKAPYRKHTEGIKGVFYFTDAVKYRCLEGYTIDGTASGVPTFGSSCQANGQFSEAVRCHRVVCGPPPDFVQTIETKDKSDRHFEDVVSFTCRSGYSLDRSHRGPKNFDLICGSDGDFHTKGAEEGALFPRCEAVSAGMTPDVLHGNLVKQEMFYGDSAWVNADEGYSYLEKPTKGIQFYLTVDTEGQYQGLKKFLPVDCGKPPVVTKATQEFNKEKGAYGDVFPYSCENGYSTDASDLEASKSFQLSCQANALYSVVPGAGECVNINDCAGHTCGPHGDCVDLLLDYKCDCEPGFEQVVDETTKEKICGNINDCGPGACGPGKCHDKVLGFECECPKGHHVEGEGDEQTCVRNVCGGNPKVGNAMPTGKPGKMVYEDTMEYICDNGHTVSGVANTMTFQEVTCEADKKFSKHEDCKPVECGKHPKLDNQVIDDVIGGTVFPGMANYRCDKGYSHDGTAEGETKQDIVCGANGQYSEPSACHPVTCGEPNTISFGQRESGEVVFPNKVEYSCFVGYTLDGQAKSDTKFDLECQANGKFTKLQQCLPVVCGEPREHINALFATAVSGVEVAFPTVTEVTCRDGYRVGGTASGSNLFPVQCEADGKFSDYNKRECLPVECGSVPEDDFANAALLVDSLDSCECYKCGQKKPHNYKSGTCGPRTPQCSTVNAKSGTCFTKAKVACDCASGKTTSPVGNNLNFEETAVMKCEKGYTAGGEFDAPMSFPVECLANGELSYPPPDMQCRNVDACGKHNCGPYGECVDVEGKDIHAYECNCTHGYEARIDEATKELKCGNIDDCEGKDCGAGTCEDMVGGYKCHCTAGHLVVVDENGDKTCMPVECEKKVPELKNGKMLSKHSGPIVFPESLRFECNEGYSIDGSVADAKKHFHANCKADGTFYGMATCQKITCGMPYAINSATVVDPSATTAILFKGEVEYKCNEGYTLKPRAFKPSMIEVISLVQSAISGPPVARQKVPTGKKCRQLAPMCRMCSRYHEGNAANEDTSCHYVPKKRKCQTGKWLQEHPDMPAEKVCGGGLVTAGQPKSQSSGDSPKTKILSDTQFSVQCQKNGVLTNPQVCNRVMCERQKPVDHATRDGGVWVGKDVHAYYQDTTFLNCDEGHTLNGEVGGPKQFERHCEADGKYKVVGMEVDACKKMSLPMPSMEHAKLVSYGGKHPEAIEIKYIGCYADNGHRDFKHGPKQYGYNPETCSQACSDYKYFALQNNGWCSCDKTYSTPDYYKRIDEKKCGTRTPALGGGWANAVYERKAKASSTEEVERIPDRAEYGNSLEWLCDNGYSLSGDPAGTNHFVTRMMGEEGFVPVPPTACKLITYSVAGEVLDASNKNKISDLIVKACSDGDCYTAKSYNGEFVIQNVPPGQYNLEYKRDGFITETLEGFNVENHVQKGEGVDMDMAPNGADDQWRIVVRWGKAPKYPDDLDVGVKWGWSHVYYGNRHASALGLTGAFEADVHYGGEGPETVFLAGVGNCRGSSQMCDIRYSVNDATNSDGEGPEQPMKSATVTAYKGSAIVSKLRYDGDNNCKLSTRDADSMMMGTIGYWDVLIIDGRTNELKWTCEEPPLPPVKTGLKMEVFYFDQSRYLPNLNQRTPDHSKTTTNINYASTNLMAAQLKNNRKEQYAIRWTGALRIEQEGEYHFELTSDDGSKMWLRERTIVNNNGLHGMVMKSGTASLGADLHAVRIEFFQKGGGAGITFKYKGPDSGEKLVWPAPAFRDSPVLNGITEEVYYFQQNKNLPDFKDRKPNQVRVVDEVEPRSCAEDKHDGLFNENFYHEWNVAIVWTGHVLIQKSGEYEFKITSDDGSKLWVSKDEHGEKLLVVDNGGLHGAKDKQGKAELETGFHRLRMVYWQKGGGACAQLMVKGPDTDDDWVVPDKDMLFRDAGFNPIDDLFAGLQEEQFYFSQGNELSGLAGKPNKIRNVKVVNYANRGGGKRFSGFSRDHDFAVRWTGSVKVKNTGTYSFYLNSDDGSAMWMGTEQGRVINNDGLHGMRKVETKQTIDKATAIRIEFFQRGGGLGCVFTYKGADSGDKEEVVPSRKLVTHSSIDGLLFEAFYFKQGKNIPDLKERAPNVERIHTGEINFRDAAAWNIDVEEQFAVALTGFINIEKAGD
jgi:hypothetical protein